MSASNPFLFQTAGLNLQLKRYPHDAKAQLKAWDAADSYLLEQYFQAADTSTKTIIINDSFGCLSLAVCAQGMTQVVATYNDSWQANEALRLNALNNELEPPTQLTSLQALFEQAQGADCVIGRVPRAKSHLKAILLGLQKVVKPGCLLLLAGMDKHLSRGQFDLLAQHFGEAEFLPGVKKARIWRARANASLKAELHVPAPYQLEQFDLSLSCGPNVFSQGKLDVGTRFMLEHFERLPSAKNLADLACGNGVLGLAYMRLASIRQQPLESVSFFDESYQAIAATVANAQGNFDAEQVGNQIQGFVCDGLKGTNRKDFDLILCNPPFHQQSTVSKAIAVSLFKDALSSLSQYGEFWLVANRHLGYHVVLKKLFGNCETVAGNSKFVLLKSRKR